MVKLGTILLFLIGIFIIVWLSLSSSASVEETYNQGDLLKLKLNEYLEPTLKIKTPSQTIIERPENNFFTLELIELGNYVLDIKGIEKSERIEFTVIEKQNEPEEEIPEEVQETFEEDFKGPKPAPEIISIKQAEHLSDNRSFIADVYDKVKERDNVFALIPSGNFLRVIFEKLLDNTKDITIFARSNNSARVEVYEKDGTEKIADFGIIDEDGKYQILLENLTGEQDTFDLKVVGGDVEFDYVVDPVTETFAIVNFTESTINEAYYLNTGSSNNLPPLWSYGWAGAQVTAGGYTNLATNNDVGFSTGASGSNGREVYTRFNLTISQTVSDINYIQILMKQRETTPEPTGGGESCYYYVANFNSGAWESFGTEVDGTTYVTRTSNLSTISNYLGNADEIVILSLGYAMDSTGTEGCDVDYVEAFVSYNLTTNDPPTHSIPILNSTLGLNGSSENLTCYNQSTSDPEGDLVKNIYNWKLGGVNFETLNMPFEGGSNSTWTREYISENNGTVYGATWGQSSGYDGFGSYSFDGNDYINVSTDLNSWLGGTASLAFWIKTTQTGSDTMWSAPGITGIEEAGGGDDIFWGWIDASGDLGFTASNGADIKTTSEINDNIWHYIVITRNATSGAAEIYVDGSLNNSGTSTPGIINNSYYSLGRIEDTGGTPTYFVGDLDDVRIYNNKIISPLQVRALYEGNGRTTTSSEIDESEIWQCSITPNDGGSDGITLNSNNLTVSDSKPPIISLISPTNGSTVANPVTLSLTTNEATWCEFSTNQTFAYGTGTTFSSGQGSLSHSTSLGILSTATHTYYIKCSDAYGNSNTEADQGQTTFTVSGAAPTHATPLLNSTYGTNYTSENLTCYNKSTSDIDGDQVKNIYSWNLNGSAFEKVNMPFEGGSTSTSTKDYSSLASIGTVYGATFNSTNGHDGFGSYGFDGSDYISVSRDLNSWLGGTASLAFWIKTTQVGSDTSWLAPGVTGIEEASGGNDIFWGWIDASGDLRFSANNGASITTTSSINDGVWHHIVITRSASTGDAQIYTDGVLNASGTSTSGTMTNSFYSFGRIEDTGGTPVYFVGDLDDIKIYNRVLSSLQVRALYEGKENIIRSTETSEMDKWQCSIIPNDRIADGTKRSTSNLTIVTQANLDINIISPINTIYNSNVTWLNYSYYDDWTMTVDSCWYNLNGGSNISVGCSNNITGITSVEENNTWIIYYNDTTGREASDNVTFLVDTLNPNITFINQTDENNLFINSTHPLEDGQNLTVYVQVNDTTTSAVWIVIWDSIKGGTTKTTSFFSLISGFLWKAIVQTDSSWTEEYNYTIYANDSGNLNDSYDWDFSTLNMNISINLSSFFVDASKNITLSGHVNLTNGTDLLNHPINIWLAGNLLQFVNVTPIGSYNSYQNFTEEDNSEFDLGTTTNITNDGENLTLSGTNLTGNYYRTLDPGARVEWNYVDWISYSPVCTEKVLTFQEGDSNGYSYTEDTYIDAGNPNSNFGGGAYFVADSAPSAQRSLIKFGNIFGSGLNQISINSIIADANITLEVYVAGNDVDIYEVLENWTEGQATYNNRFTGTAWGSTGVAGSPSRSTILEDTLSMGGTGSYAINITDVMKKWVNETSENYGIVFNPTGGGATEIRSKEFGTPSQRPKLSVRYTPIDCTEMGIYVRLSNDKSSWTTWQLLSDGDSINDNGNSYRYLQYWVNMSTDNSSLKPSLDEIIFNYTAIVTDSSGDYNYNFTSSSNSGLYEINVSSGLRTMERNATIQIRVTGTPSVPILNAPSNASFISSVGELNWTNSTDYELDEVFYILEVDNDSDFSSFIYSNYTISETPSPTGDTPSTISEDGTYFWRVKAFDLVGGNSSWSDVWQFTLDSYPPSLNFTNQTDEDKNLVNDSNPLMQGENITFYVNASDDNLDRVWVVVWSSIKEGAEKIKVFFTYVAGFLWVATVQTDDTWGNLDYNYTIYTNDSLNQEDYYDGNFSMINLRLNLTLDPNPIEFQQNVSAYGYLNFSNGTFLPYHPINLWFKGELLLLADVLPNDDFENYINLTDTSNNEFNFGNYFNTTSDSQNLTLSSGSYSGNYTKILDAGAMVEWNNFVWQSTGVSCSGTSTYQEGDSNGYSGTRDTYVDGVSTGSNFATTSFLSVDSNPVYRSLIKFEDVVGFVPRGIPIGATINEANMTIQIYDNGNDPTVYEILENWTESQATYDNRLTGTAWGSTGVAAYPSRSNTAEDTFSGGAGSVTFDITNAFTRWASETSENYGVVLHPGGTNGINLRSSEYSTQSERPLLMVNYDSNDCTNVKFYVRLSNDKSTWTSWEEITSGSLINDEGKPYRYLEYRTELATTDNSLTPYVENVFANFTAITTNSTGYYDYDFLGEGTFGSYEFKVNTSYRTMYIEATENLSVQSGVDPVVTLLTPSPGAWYNYTGFNLTYNATDINHDIQNASLIINGTENDSTVVVVEAQINNFTINFGSGFYNWTVEVFDFADNMGTYAVRTFYIDLENPNVTLWQPPNESTYSVTQLDLNFSVTDNLDGVLSCSVMLDGSVIASPNVNNNTNKTVPSGSLTNGLHFWNVTCIDNSLRRHTSPTFQFNISDTPPEVELMGPPEGYTDSDGNINFIYKATDNSDFINCSLYINEIFNSSNQTSIFNGQNNTITTIGLIEGNYNWTVGCYDDGQLYDEPSVRNFSVDLYYPLINLNMPGNLSVVNVADVSLNFTVNDTVDDPLTCNITINGQVVGNPFSANNGSLTNKVINDLTDGAKYWNVSCVDEANHINTSSTWVFNVSEPPRIFLNTSNETSLQLNNINLSYTPYDNTNISNCSLYLNGAYNQSNSTNVLNEETSNFSLYGLSDGNYYWYVNCSDTFVASNVSVTNMFSIDSEAPNINLHSPDGGDIYSYNTTFNFTVIDSLDLTLTCNITVDGSVVAGPFSASNGSFTVKPVQGITDGLKYWYVNCTDSANNLGNSSVYNFTKYSTPSVTLTSPGDGDWFNISTFNLTYYIEDDSGFSNSSLILNGEINQSNTTNLNNMDYNNFSLINYPDGQYIWTVNATDLTGLVGTDTERTFYIDTKVPELTLNYPNESETINTNNVTFNFSVIDYVDATLDCDVFVDGEKEYTRISSNASTQIHYLSLVDDNHNWYTVCNDSAGNSNKSITINFVVEAPPNVTLESPPTGNLTKDFSMVFNYTPEDAIGIDDCYFYLDGALNDTDLNPVPNQQNSFTIEGISEGQHNWTVNCTDPDANYHMPSNWTFYTDLSPPHNISLGTPSNDSGIDFNDDTVTFTWTPTDLYDSILQCNLTVDGVVEKPNAWVSSGAQDFKDLTTAYLGQGIHYWNVTCWDRLKNYNTSETRTFNINYPDFSVNSSGIYFNESSPKENVSVEINATIFNLGNTDSTNVPVSFFDGNPISGGTLIGTDTINLAASEQANASVVWIPDIGTSEIYVFVDYTNSFIESNESNNNASKNSTVGSWHYFYGNISASSIFKLADEGNETVLKWIIDNFESGNVYVTDYGASVSWADLLAIGKTTLGGDSSSDFSEIDTVIGSAGYSDSVYETYTNSGTIKEKDTFLAFKNTITEVPVMNSTNNTNFKTGILWDSSGDIGPDNEYDSTDKEEIVFVSKLNKNAQGTYGNYDYEIRVPARLRYYDNSNTYSAEFYVEIK